MAGELVSKRYARGLFELAKEKNVLDQVETGLNVVSQALKDVPEFETFLLHPQIDAAEKKEKLRNIFQDKISEYVLSLIFLLLDRGRTEAFAGIVEEYVKFANEARGVENAIAYSAVPLDEAQLKSISEQFGKKIGKTLQLTNVIDKSIIGGLVIQVGDLIYDGSVKNKLTRFKQTLA